MKIVFADGSIFDPNEIRKCYPKSRKGKRFVVEFYGGRGADIEISPEAQKQLARYIKANESEPSPNTAASSE